MISPQRRPLQQASSLAGRASASPPPWVLRQVVALKHREPLCPLACLIPRRVSTAPRPSPQRHQPSATSARLGQFAPPWLGMDRPGILQALVGLILGLIALLTSYDHINLFGHILPLPQQWGIPCIAASVATVFIDAQLATRSRLRAEHRAARAADVAAGRRSLSSSRAIAALPGADGAAGAWGS